MVTKKDMTVEETLRRIVAKVTNKKDVVLIPTGTFKELGVDSLDTVQILVAIEDALEIDLEDKDMKSIKNIGGFINYLDKKVAEKKSVNS